MFCERDDKCSVMLYYTKKSLAFLKVLLSNFPNFSNITEMFTIVNNNKYLVYVREAILNQKPCILKSKTLDKEIAVIFKR